MKLTERERLDDHPLMKAMGPEPLGNEFDAAMLARACKGFEQLVPKFGLNSWTGIRYLDYQAARVPQGHYPHRATRGRKVPSQQSKATGWLEWLGNGVDDVAVRPGWI